MKLFLKWCLFGVLALGFAPVTFAQSKGVSVDHTPVLFATPYEDLVIKAKIFPADSLKTVWLRYRASNQKQLESVVMSRSSEGVYSGIIPASGISTSGVLYFIVGRDVADQDIPIFASAERPHAVSGRSLVVFQSGNVSLYDDVLAGIRKEFTGHLKIIDLTPHTGPQGKVMDLLQRDPPPVVVTLGQGAAQIFRESPLSRKVPVVYAMVADPDAHGLKTSHSTGVSFDISPRSILETMKAIMPKLERVGVVYDPLRTGSLVEEARSLAPSMGYEILATRIEEAGELESVLRAFEKGVDIFWLLPDSTVLSGQNYDHLLKFSREFRVPIFAFSQELVRKGSLLSITPDYQDLGVQVGLVVKKVLDGTDAKLIPVVKPRKMKLSLNMNVAKSLKIENIAQQIVNYSAERDVPLRVFK